MTASGIEGKMISATLQVQGVTSEATEATVNNLAIGILAIIVALVVVGGILAVKRLRSRHPKVFCIGCGARLASGVEFCPKCGAKQVRILRVEGGEGTGMIGLESKMKAVYVMVFILLTFGAMMEPVSAQGGFVTVQAKLIPPNPYQVYTSETYSLTIGVQYNVPTGYYLWIESPPYRTDGMTVSGSGMTAFSLVLTAPSTPGTYTLPLTLYGQTRGAARSVMDTASVTYRVIQPIVTDWDVEKVSLDPAAPGAGDKVTFHTTISLLSTNSKDSLSVDVACSLDKRLYYAGSLTFAPQPSKQDVTIPEVWTATKGDNTLTCFVDPNHKHNDPTPYPNYDYKTIKFTVQPYYAIIESITTSPSPEVKEGDEFDVVVTDHVPFSWYGHFEGESPQ